MGKRQSVTLAYLHHDEVTHSFQQSLQNLLVYEMGQKTDRLSGGYMAMSCKAGAIVEGRNKVVQEFLDLEQSGEWLFWIDTDMGFEANALERLLLTADRDKYPIVGGLCFAQKETEEDGYSGFNTRARVTIMDWQEELQAFAGRSEYPPNAMVPCGATGSAFILIHRSVLEKMEEEYGTWYDRVPAPDGKLMGEDISFCARAGALGYPVYVNTGVRTTHLKHVWLGEADFWEQHQAPPALETVAVLVPVLGRPHHAEPFMATLRASTGLATAYAIVDDGDPAGAAWRRAGAVTIPSNHSADEPGSFAQKVNLGYSETEEPWVFIVGSDVEFRPGWLDHAQEVAELYEASVVGTNDLGNPRVMRGEHATHLLIRRAYIDAVGASWDGPKVLAHEGYHHWYVDDEIVTAARQRAVWAMALGSKVEHLHPYWGKGRQDGTYARGAAHSEEDGALFEKRWRANK